MSGGEPTPNTSSMNIAPQPRGPPTDNEEVLEDVQDEDEDEGEEADLEGLKVRKGKETKSEVVLEKAGKEPL